jgi:hypothetical protein
MKEGRGRKEEEGRKRKEGRGRKEVEERKMKGGRQEKPGSERKEHDGSNMIEGHMVEGRGRKEGRQDLDCCVLTSSPAE